MIESGRAIALDCYAIGKSIEADEPIGKLFSTDIMNKSILMKRYEPALSTARQDILINTVVYFPYDFDNPYDGGESIDFNGFGFPGLLLDKISLGSPTPELTKLVDRDVEMLNLIDSMHSLDPFMFKSKAEQQDKDDEIHPAYFDISEAEWDKIRLPIRDKISKLVTKALGGSTGTSDNLAREQYVERFLMKIWQAKDIEGIEPFVKAMQIEPERAPDVFFAWKAVCYYQVRFTELIEDLRTFFQWVGSNELCFPLDTLGMSDDEKDNILDRRERLRKKIRESHLKANRVINEYENSYNQFIVEDKPQAFMAFLENSANSYLNLAAHVSSATHSINLWKWYMSQFGGQLRRAQFVELFDGLTMLNGVKRTDEVSTTSEFLVS
ncbi:MAG: hypothetical protein JKY20_11585 [Alphaproteobacteria bacterium]|nr:hypothetical protein [Alphaproteobacteria bacterium]